MDLHESREQEQSKKHSSDSRQQQISMVQNQQYYHLPDMFLKSSSNSEEANPSIKS